MIKFIKPTAIETYGIGFTYDNKLRLNRYFIKSTEFRGKQLAFGFDTDPRIAMNPCPTHNWLRGRIDASDSPFLWIAPECSIARDSIRNSGYKIVRDKEKATCRIVPKISVVSSFKYHFCIIGPDNGVICFYRFNEEEAEITPELIKDTIEKCRKGRFETVDEQQLTIIDPEEAHPCLQTAYTIKSCEEYDNMFNGADNADYCFECNVRLQPSIEVTPELFAIWGKCNEDSIIASAVLQADWQTYPLTIAVFLREHFPYIYGTSRALDNVLDQIRFQDIRKHNTSSLVVSPEDWNMLQKCKLYELGLSENGGLVDSDKEVSGCLPHKTVVKPLYINEPCNFDSLKDMVKNA
jgi:hypothetical protein